MVKVKLHELVVQNTKLHGIRTRDAQLWFVIFLMQHSTQDSSATEPPSWIMR